MTYKQNTAEGGTNGTTVTTGNSGGASGDAFSDTTTGITFSNAITPMHGSLCYRHAGTAATYNALQLTDPSPAAAFSCSFYTYLTGSPSADLTFLDIQTAAGASVAAIVLTTGRIISVQQASGWLVDFTNPIPLTTWTRVVMYGTVAASNASLTCKMYPGDSLTPTETRSSSTANTGATNPDHVFYGKLDSPPSMATYYIDDIRQNLASNSEILPSAASTPRILRPPRAALIRASAW